MVIEGDFNSVLLVSKQSIKRFLRHNYIEEFFEAVFESGLLDVCFDSAQYTWNDSTLWQRVDRVLFLSDWVDMFGGSKVIHIPRYTSDHCPILVLLGAASSNKRPLASFWFQNIWCHHSKLSDVTRELWHD